MFIVTNRIPVAAGHEEDFEERFRNRAHLIDQHPGFVKNLMESSSSADLSENHQ